jgi:hypothetical protein
MNLLNYVLMKESLVTVYHSPYTDCYDREWIVMTRNPIKKRRKGERNQNGKSHHAWSPKGRR